MARHRKIDIRMWGDAKFRALSAPPPNAQTLWVYLLTGPHTTSIPGLSVVGEAGLAEALGWSLKDFRKAFREVLSEGMAEADFESRVLWVPKAIFYNIPESPNVIKSWSHYWDEIPECALKIQAYAHISEALKTVSDNYLKSFEKSCRNPSIKPQVSRNKFLPTTPSNNQEQEQEQDNTPLTPLGGGLTPLPASLDTPEFRKAWQDWQEHRRQIRHPLKPKTRDKQLKQFERWGPAKSVAAIEQSILNGWQGVFEPHQGKAPPAANGPPRETKEERDRQKAEQLKAREAAQREQAEVDALWAAEGRERKL